MKKLPFFTILSVLLFLAAVAVIAFPTTTTTHIQGTAEKWSNDETYLGTGGNRYSRNQKFVFPLPCQNFFVGRRTSHPSAFKSKGRYILRRT